MSREMTDKAIITALAKVQGEVKANCKCGGRGKRREKVITL